MGIATPPGSDRVRWLMALLEIPGLGPAAITTLIRRYGTVERLVAAIEDQRASDRLIEVVRRSIGAVDWSAIGGEIKVAEDNGIAACTLEDDEYPENLREISGPPPVLWYRGTLKSLRRRALACVGTTEPSPRGVQRAKKFARQCVENQIQVISGLARGIDTASHLGALETGGVTHAVLGHGLMHLYPPENAGLAEDIIRTGGALISQFRPTAQASRWTFPQRNETMCAIAQGTVIIEIELDRKKGSLIQATFSLKHGRPIFILGSNIDEIRSEDARRLVEGGDAVRVDAFEDVLKSLRRSDPAFAPKDLFAKAREGPGDGLAAILFDLDGVIHDPAPIMMRAYRAALAASGRKAPDEAELRRHLVLSPRRVLRRFGGDARAERVYRDEFAACLEKEICVVPGVVDFIQRLSGQGIRVGIVTSQPRGRCAAILRRCGLDALDVVITWNDVPSGRYKPDPYPLQQALSILGVRPGEAIYVGDTPDDLLAARNAKVRSVAVGWGLSPLEELARWRPDLMVARPEDLPMILTDLPPAPD